MLPPNAQTYCFPCFKMAINKTKKLRNLNCTIILMFTTPASKWYVTSNIILTCNIYTINFLLLWTKTHWFLNPILDTTACNLHVPFTAAHIYIVYIHVQVTVTKLHLKEISQTCKLTCPLGDLQATHDWPNLFLSQLLEHEPAVTC